MFQLFGFYCKEDLLAYSSNLLQTNVGIEANVLNSFSRSFRMPADLNGCCPLHVLAQ